MITAKEVKLNNEVRLKKEGIPVNEYLPLIEEVTELTPPDAKTVAIRAFIVGYLIGLHYEVSGEKLTAYLQQYKLWDYVTDTEKAFLKKVELTNEEKNDIGYWCECIQVLAWALGLTGLDHKKPCEETLADLFPPYVDPWFRINTARLVPFELIYEQCDLLYRLHWAVKHADKELPYDQDIIMERHKAINWLAGVEKNWDQVTTDT
jgi:hypothetical protein